MIKTTCEAEKTHRPCFISVFFFFNNWEQQGGIIGEKLESSCLEQHSFAVRPVERRSETLPHSAWVSSGSFSEPFFFIMCWVLPYASTALLSSLSSCFFIDDSSTSRKVQAHGFWLWRRVKTTTSLRVICNRDSKPLFCRKTFITFSHDDPSVTSVSNISSPSRHMRRDPVGIIEVSLSVKWGSRSFLSSSAIHHHIRIGNEVQIYNALRAFVYRNSNWRQVRGLRRNFKWPDWWRNRKWWRNRNTAILKNSTPPPRARARTPPPPNPPVRQ